jgi:hypothetical protein
MGGIQIEFQVVRRPTANLPQDTGAIGSKHIAYTD